MVEMVPVPPGTRSARAERDRYVAFAFAAADLLLEVDGSGRIKFAAGALQSLTKRDAEALTGAPFQDILAPDDRPLAKVMLASLKRGGRLSPIVVRLADAAQPTAMLGGCRLPAAAESYQLTFTVLPPVGQTTAAGARDAKTGLLEKEDFARLAEKYLHQPEGGDLKLSLLAVDGLDSMREQADEELSAGFLSALGRQIRAHSADGDAAGQLSDGHFGVIHRGEFDTDALNRQIAELAASVDLGGKVAVTNSSMSLAAGDLSAADAARTLVYAINSFAQSQGGEFTLTSLSDGFDTLISATASKVRDLRGTLATRDFSLAYQPIVSLANRSIHHFEALARFTGARAGGASPAEVVGFAEQIGVIIEFDLAVCQRVINVLADITEPSRRPPIAINFSGRSLESSIFAAEVDSLVRANPTVASNLMFEITESAHIVQLTEVQNFLQTLRGRGFRVCLDDFGAGSASFHYLSAFPVDFVKIDGKYVRNIGGSARLRAFLKAMATLCRDLGTASIAEMVETEAQAAEVANLGVGYGQGYLFGKPSPTLGTIEPQRPPMVLHQHLTARQAAAAERREQQRVISSGVI
jgi:EAL domain-containing protein (putative c-di-GMP-specific phosphodiesterase class I)